MHIKVLVRKELEMRMNDWKIFLESTSKFNQIIKQQYSKHHPLIKYLDNENLHKVDLTV
jgi:hypothetical protein